MFRSLVVFGLLLGASGASFSRATWSDVYGKSMPVDRYRYQGAIYDRVLSVSTRPAPETTIRARVARITHLPGTPYEITDLAPFVKKLLYGQRLYHVNDDGFAVAAAVNNRGRIAVSVPCGCFFSGYGSLDGGFSGVFDLAGHIYNVMFPFFSEYAVGQMTVYALNNVGGEAGQWYEHDDGPVRGNIGWTDSGKRNYVDGAHGGNVALAIDDEGVAVGRDYAPGGIYAAAFSYARHRLDLQSPQGASCPAAAPPMATGINDAGQIVGYSCDTATAFSQTGYAAYLPVAAAGVSSAAQAINARGDVVGSAGGQAFLYRNGKTVYLPRPAGERAGNAVAYALNGSDEVVGDIVNGSSTTAFVYVNGQSYDLNALPGATSAWQITHASGINDSGEIVGAATYTGRAGPVVTSFSMQPRSSP